MQLKRIFVTLLVAIVVLSMAGLAVSAAGTGTFDIAVESNSTAGVESLNPGDVVEIKVVIQNNPGASQVEIDLVYDPAVLVPVDADNNGKTDIALGNTYAFDAPMIASKGDNKMLLVLSRGEATNLTCTGTAFTVSFKITEAFTGDASVAISATAMKTDFTGVKACDPINFVVAVSTCHFDYANPVTENATCVKDGRVYVKCTDNGCTEIKVLSTTPALDHDEVAAGEKKPTCTEAGNTAGVNCSRCDYTTVTELTALNHDEVAVSEVKPTCTEVGYTAGVNCSRCEYTTVTEVKALDHTEAKLPAVEATCANAGVTEGTYCTTCNVIIVMPEPVAKKDHTVKKLDAVEATCTSKGLTEGEICDVCKTLLKAQDVVAAKGHTYTSAVTAPTCTTLGFTTYTCACGDTYKADYVGTADHTYTTVVDRKSVV